jgi:ABC-2 type transport system permease protein
MLLSGTFMPVKDLPMVLKPLAYCMTPAYANIALRDVMIKGWEFVQIYPNLLILTGFAAIFILVDVPAVKREIDEWRF